MNEFQKETGDPLIKNTRSSYLSDDPRLRRCANIQEIDFHLGNGRECEYSDTFENGLTAGNGEFC